MESRLRPPLASERGAITILVALMLVVFLGVTALVVDLGRTRHARQQLQDALDSASLAATAFLPAHSQADINTVNAIVAKIATASADGLAASDLTTTFWCVMRTPPNAIGGLSPDLGTGIGYACGPKIDGTWDSPAGWTTNGSSSRMSHACDPAAGDWCNAVRVETAQTVQYLFAPAIGVDSGSTGAVQSTACQGACKSTGAPLDVAVVLDRTGSMTAADLTNAKEAAKELLKVYVPAQQRVGLLALPYPAAANRCAVQSPQEYPDAVPDYAKWLVKGLSSDYDYSSGTLTGDLVAKIDCLVRAGSHTIKVAGNITSGGHTNLGDPIAAAGDLLAKTGRAGVPHVIIFMTDGQANQPWYPSNPNFDHPCGYAATRADFAKSQAEVYTVAYGIGDDAGCPDTSGVYRVGGGRNGASWLLADMATQPSDTFESCGPNENTDGDHYFCEDKSGDLSAVFRQIAQATVSHGRLIDAG